MAKKSFKDDNPALAFISDDPPERRPTVRPKEGPAPPPAAVIPVHVATDTGPYTHTHDNTDASTDTHTHKYTHTTPPRRVPQRKEAKTRRLQLLTKPSTHDRLRALSEAYGTSVNDIVNSMVEECMGMWEEALENDGE